MKIFVADDHELFLKGLELILSDIDENVELTFAHNYTDIFNIIEQKQDFNLVLTDLAMPGANWLEAIKRIHEKLPETPIIILSAVFDKVPYSAKAARRRSMYSSMGRILPHYAPTV